MFATYALLEFKGTLPQVEAQCVHTMEVCHLVDHCVSSGGRYFPMLIQKVRNVSFTLILQGKYKDDYVENMYMAVSIAILFKEIVEHW